MPNPSLRHLILIIDIICLVLMPANGLQPTAPVVASPNTQLSPSNFIFSFELINNMLATSYIMVVLPIYPSLITPSSCILLGTTNTATSCVNLYTASNASPNPLTINTTAVSTINPNIQNTMTIVVGFSSPLSAGVSYSLQIILADNLPAIGALSQSFQMYVISGTGIMEQQNWNMGQLYLQLKNNNLMNMVSINAENGNFPGTTVSTLLIDVTIGVNCPTALSTFLLTISGNFQFTVSSLVSSIAVAGTPPQIQTTTVVSANIITVVFNQQFVIGRQFRLSISNVFNPLQISQGAVSVYSMPYNSISPLEVSQLTIPFQTISYSPTISIFTAEGLSPTAPIEFYMQTNQYITIKILMPINFNPSYSLQINSDTLMILQGTVFAITSTINTNTLTYTMVNGSAVIISGFSTLPSGTMITVTMQVWIYTNPIFNIYVSIDTPAHISAGLPIIFGTSSATVTANPVSFISAFTGSEGQTNKLTAMQTTFSSISFSVTPLFQTYTGSFLQIYTSVNLVADITFSNSTSCLINSASQPCTLTTNTQYTVITIASSSSFNLYPQSVTTTIQINNVKFMYASSHSFYIYHFYFMLTVSLATQATVQKYLINPMVVQQRNQLPTFSMYFSNTIYNSGSNYLNVIRLVSPTITEFQNILQVNQKRIITIFAYQSWLNLFTNLSSYSPYPCSSNLAVTCTYISGSNSLNISTSYPLDWDRINIVLPGTESTTKFSIILPTQYLSNSSILFEVMIGFIQTTNGAITYLHSEAMPNLGAPTFLNPSTVAVYSTTQQTGMMLNVAGQAGSYMSNVSISVTPSNAFTGSSYSTSLIIMSSWQFYDSTTALSASSLSSGDPIFANIEQTPMCLQISSTSYLTYIPFTSASFSSFSIYFDNVKLPYNLDLPYYSMSLITSAGSLDGYNQFINQNQNIFYTGVLKYLDIICNDNSLGVTNTYCTVTFTPFEDIIAQAVLIVNFYGMSVSTSLCSMMYSASNASIPISSCTPNTNLNILTITLANSVKLPALSSYALVVNGISIDASQILNYIQLQVMDSTGSYVIEQKSVILIPSVAQNFPIYITQVNFAYNNPVVTSSLFLNFTLPRPLNMDESFALIMSKDFMNLNSIPCKLQIRLMQSDGLTQIPTQWILKTINSQIIFQGLQDTLAATAYSLEIYGVITPSTITQNTIGIIYLRIYDNTYTKSNTESSTAIFPSLVSKVNSLITLQTYFNTEGSQHELLFTVINQFVQINQHNIWIINFPRYYSPLLWNDDTLIYCTINGVPLTCTRSTYTRYSISLSGAPLIIETGSTYTISVYGITCPRATYLNGNNLFVTQNIFFGMATSSASTSYSDYSQLYVSNQIINPQTVGGYGAIVLQSVTSSNMQVYQTTFFTIVLTCTVAISQTQWIFITFPSQFNNFNNIPVIVQTQYTTNIQVSNTSTVINTRIGYQINTLNIPANTQFSIIITSLLTPTNPSTINMNTLKVLVSSADRLTTTATSVQSRNQLSSLTFVPNSLHLVVNNYLPITITAGTYSTPIRISPSDNTTFQTNMLITQSSTQISFYPNPLYMYLGNSYSTFIIGAEQNLIPTTYTFNLAKKETSISSYYSVLSEYAVVVNSIPITITFPSSFTVPIGGCSMPVTVSITNPPYSSLNINFQYNTTALPPNQFWINQQISYEQMSFDINDTSRWISFCSNYTQAATSFSISMQLGGDNAASYVLSNGFTTVNIVSNNSINSTPTFTLSVANVQKTFASFKVQTNIPGLFFYHLNLSPLSSPLSSSSIKSLVKSNNIIISSNTNYLTTQIYNTDLDQRVGYSPVLIAGSNYFSIQNLLPQRTYTLCGYFQSQFGVIANYQCVNFVMQTWGVIRKASVKFNTPILANSLNNVLCFFVKASNSEINQITDLQGNSCSLSTSPQNYNYLYKGNTTTNQLSSTIIYHTANPNLTSDASSSAFSNLFGLTGLSTTSLALAQTQFSINFISSSILLTSFDPMTAINLASSSFYPQISLNVQSYTPGTFKVYITGISSNVPATLYLILVSYKNITTNQITSKTSISIKTLVTPTNSAIASCIDGSGATAVQCMRVVMLTGTSYSLTISNIVENSVYALQYTVANEYPLRPVFYGNVQTQYIFTLNWEQSILGKLGIMLLIIMLMA